MKKDVLFIMNNLHCGGAEKSLISMLHIMDYSKFNVDLYLFKKEGLFLNQLPAEVNILPQPENYPYFDMPLSQAVFKNLKKGNFRLIWNRLLTGLVSKTEKIRTVKEQKSWKYLKSVVPPLEKTYDVAIGYLEKTPNYFCVDKVDAKIKIGFVNNDYEKLEMDPEIDRPYFKKLNYVATVSEECLASLRRSFPEFPEKLIIIDNVSSPDLIKRLSDEKIEPLFNGLKLLTIGRLSPQKGYHLAIDAAKILKDSFGLDFRWYILGMGELHDELQRQIAANGLQENFVFLGLKENPYPYLKQADIYVQTSLFEGKSLAIDEAKILSKPILVTHFPSVIDQITHLVNGYIVDIAPQSIAEGISALSKNQALRENLSASLKHEKLETQLGIDKLYAILNQ